MRRVLALVLLAAMPAMAAAEQVESPGRSLGSVIVRARVVGVAPQDTASTITRLGGKWGSSAEAGADLDVSVFLTSHLALALGASTSRHAFQLSNTAFGTVPVGNARLIVPSLMLQYHFDPGWSVHPYLGAGPSAAVLIDPKPGGTLVDQLYFDSKVGVAFQAGIDIELGGPFMLNADVKQLLVRTAAFSPHPGRTPVKAQVQFNPTVFGLGLGVQF